jgi:hypothetical protein
MDNSPIKNFKNFVNKEIIPATKDLENLGAKNRVHVQKLVYTNLVDRFDTMIDLSILENCREEYLANEALKKLTNPMTEASLLRFLMHSDNLKDTINLKVKDGLRDSVLRERHSKKLSTLLKVFKPEVESWNIPRVNISTGVIVEKIKPHSKTQPYSICGHADWLYSRRNSIVHGDGKNKLLTNDLKQLKKLFNCTSTPGVKLLLSSVKNAITFYVCIVDILLKKGSSQ